MKKNILIVISIFFLIHTSIVLADEAYYNFSEGEGVDHFAYETSDEGIFPCSDDWTYCWSGTEISDYTLIDTDDDVNRWLCVNGGANFEPVIRFNFTVTETPTWIYWIINSNATIGGGEDADCFVANFNTPVWEKICDIADEVPDTDCWINISTNPEYYKDTNDQIVAACEGKSLDEAGEMEIDYVNLTIGYAGLQEYSRNVTDSTQVTDNDEDLSESLRMNVTSTTSSDTSSSGQEFFRANSDSTSSTDTNENFRELLRNLLDSISSVDTIGTFRELLRNFLESLSVLDVMSSTKQSALEEYSRNVSDSLQSVDVLFEGSELSREFSESILINAIISFFRELQELTVTSTQSTDILLEQQEAYRAVAESTTTSSLLSTFRALEEFILEVTQINDVYSALREVLENLLSTTLVIDAMSSTEELLLQEYEEYISDVLLTVDTLLEQTEIRREFSESTIINAIMNGYRELQRLVTGSTQITDTSSFLRELLREVSDSVIINTLIAPYKALIEYFFEALTILDSITRSTETIGANPSTPTGGLVTICDLGKEVCYENTIRKCVAYGTEWTEVEDCLSQNKTCVYDATIIPYRPYCVSVGEDSDYSDPIKILIPFIMICCAVVSIYIVVNYIKEREKKKASE